MAEPNAHKSSTEFDHIADDLFAGAGGWDLGAEALGIHARGVEIMQEARDTRDAAGLTTIHDDVWTYEPDGKASGLIASPPCQTFSAAGKGAGRKALDDVLGGIWTGAYRDRLALRDLGEKVGDDRTALVLTPLHFAVTGGYSWLAWEQVPPVLPVWQACAEVLRAEGWNVWVGYLHAEQYGTAQTRKRAGLLASREGAVEMPAPTHSKFYSRDPGKLDLGVEKWVSMFEALGFGLAGRPSPTVTGGGVETGGAEPIAKLARYTSRPDWVLRNNNTANAAVRHLDQPAPTLFFGQRCNYVAWERATHMGDVYNSKGCIRSMDEPAPTMTGSMDNGNFRWFDNAKVDPETGRDPDSVRVSVAEAGVLQSFPRDYPWQGTKGKQFLQCGNAVPPRMAMHALAAASGIAIETKEAVA